VNPAVAVAAGVALLGEPFTAGTFVGFVLILAGSWLATGAAAQGALDPRRVTARLPDQIADAE
jgi:drug/metabolite transporter (DMT)-like permease